MDIRKTQALRDLLKDKSLLKEKCYIDGKWVGGSATIDVTNPVDESVIGTVPKLGAAEARQAIEAAQKARELARSLRTRDISAGAQYDRYPVSASNTLGTGNSYGVFVSIPLFVNYAFEGEMQRAEVNEDRGEQAPPLAVRRQRCEIHAEAQIFFAAGAEHRHAVQRDVDKDADVREYDERRDPQTRRERTQAVAKFGGGWFGNGFAHRIDCGNGAVRRCGMRVSCQCASAHCQNSPGVVSARLSGGC